MIANKHFCLFIACLLAMLLFTSCDNQKKKPGSTIVSTPQEMQQKSPDLIRSYVELALNDNKLLSQAPLIQMIYEKNNYQPVWSKEQQWLSLGDSLYNFINDAQLFGLFPEDYHYKEIKTIRFDFFRDSLVKGDRKDAALWARADVMLTDAFVQILKDIKLGRLPQDSITLRKDSVLNNEFYQYQFDFLQRTGSIVKLVSLLEPKQKGYKLLKEGIRKFLDSSDSKEYTVVPEPGDSGSFRKALQTRLYEAGFLATDSIEADSLHIAAAVKKFQLRKGITADGKVGSTTLRILNLSDREKFIRIAISMDKYKMLPEKMPDRFIWVNLPGYYLQLMNNDTVEILSKIICGKPLTRTPQLSSAISEMITYPQWTVPTSIIVKEILPAVKKNPGYLAHKGFSLVDSKGDEIDPFTVTWSKYSKGIPYKVVQGSGDDNALGILKFNFNNKYAVYLHDTNQRYLFSQAVRALSHGCVRVQEWQSLANYILKNDSLSASGRNYVKADSLRSWLVRKEKHSIPVHNRIPLFIRYFTADTNNGNIVFYDDIYGEDKKLRERYFANK